MAPERLEGGRLAELYLRHADGARRLAYLLTGHRELAEDITQEAFIRLTGRLMHARDRAAFDAYLRRTVVNLAISHFRRRRSEESKTTRLAALPAPANLESDVATRDALRRALLELGGRQRAAVVLRFYEDLSERQTAEILGCRPGTVKSLVSRAMETLRVEIMKEDHR